MQNLFSYPLLVEDISVKEKKFKLAANKNELAYIKDILKVPDVKSFKANLEVSSDRESRLITVRGKVLAELEQQSVISLENFIKNYETEFVMVFNPFAKPEKAKEKECEYDEEIEDMVENGQIDLAAVAMEQLALVIDDYPRKEGEEFSFQSEFVETEEEKEANNPFSVLKKLKK